MNKVISCCFSLLLLSTAELFSQSVTYSYDASGNRVSRSISISHVRQRGLSTDTETPKADDLSERVRVTVDANNTSVAVLIDAFKDTDRCAVSLFSVSGMHLCNIAVVSDRTVVDLSPYPSGIYIIQVSLNGKTDAWKVAIR